MEIANQLLGVTMHEPGVSRIVAVDIEEAAELAAMYGGLPKRILASQTERMAGEEKYFRLKPAVR